MVTDETTDNIGNSTDDYDFEIDETTQNIGTSTVDYDFKIDESAMDGKPRKKNKNFLKIRDRGTIDLAKMFKEVSNVTKLDGKGNICPKISDDSLNSFPMLKEFIFSSNGVVEIDRKAFQTNKKLATIKVSHNRIKKILSETFSVATLHELDLCDNAIKIIEDDAFLGAKDLTILTLEKNKLHKIPNSIFSHTKTLKGFILSENFIEEIPNGIFKHLTKLQYLDLSRNQIKSIGKKSLQGLKNLNYLFLDRNEITELTPNTFEHCPKMKDLHLNGNRIGRISTDAFHQLDALLKLYLTNNRIERIEKGTLANIPELTHLHLDNNSIETIHADTFFGCDQLKTIGLRNNNIVAVSLESFAKLKHLRSVNLLGNICYHKPEWDNLDPQHLKATLEEKDLKKCFRGYNVMQKYKLQNSGPLQTSFVKEVYLMPKICFISLILLILGSCIAYLLIRHRRATKQFLMDTSRKMNCDKVFGYCKKECEQSVNNMESQENDAKKTESHGPTVESKNAKANDMDSNPNNTESKETHADNKESEIINIGNIDGHNTTT